MRENMYKLLFIFLNFFSIWEMTFLIDVYAKFHKKKIVTWEWLSFNFHMIFFVKL